MGLLFFWDAVEYVWIRSGSATGVGGIKKRNQTHLSRAKSPENPDNSKLYDRYPSQLSIRSKYDHETHFEKLCVYIPLAFSGDDAGLAACLFGKDYRKEGLFFYTAEEERTISGTNFRGKVGRRSSCRCLRIFLNWATILHSAAAIMCLEVLGLRAVV